MREIPALVAVATLSLGARCGGGAPAPPNVYFHACPGAPEYVLEYKTAANLIPQGITPGCHFIANPIGLHARCSADNPERNSDWIAITVGPNPGCP
jgi:hypothetical protein